MVGRRRGIVVAVAGFLTVAGALAATHAQAPSSPLPTGITAIRHNSGQSVIPYFEGWIRHPDGTIDIVFGYFNRNYVQEFAIPAGPENRVEPGPVDQGQPTYFLPRRQRYVFRVRVPADFGQKDVIWTITSNGRPERGYGNLLPEQEITERVVTTNGNFNPGHDDPNKPPALEIASVGRPRLGQPITLTAKVTDDGLPKIRPAAPAPRDRATGPGLGAQINTSATRPRETTLTWLQYSGPAKVIFGHMGTLPVVNGQAVTTATFTAPGSYTLIASAADPGRLSTKVEITVTVPPNP